MPKSKFQTEKLPSPTQGLAKARMSFRAGLITIISSIYDVVPKHPATKYSVGSIVPDGSGLWSQYAGSHKIQVAPQLRSGGDYGASGN